jgi:hypothetical protein
METLGRSVFWRFLAAVAVLSLAMMGYAGLQSGPEAGLVTEARASQIALTPLRANTKDVIITASPDGSTIYEWGRLDVVIRQSSGSCVKRPYTGLR